LARALGEKVTETRPPVEKPLPDASKFEISRAVVAQDFGKFRALHEAAAQEGKQVVFVD
jgi:hypothetical protein